MLADEANWILLTDEAIESLDYDTISNAKHLLAVGQKCPADLVFLDNVELDGATGARITRFTRCEPDSKGAVKEFRNILRSARMQGHEKAILILDSAYQFSVSIGVYVRQRNGVQQAEPASSGPQHVKIPFL